MGSEEKPAEQAWVPTFPLLRKIDHAIFTVERSLCSAMFVVMALIVFMQLISDAFATRHKISDVILLAGVVLIALLTRTVKPGEQRWPIWKFAAFTVGITGVLSGIAWYLSTYYVGKLIWSSNLALVLMLWVALVGSSLATYERTHLALEFGEKLWPEAIRHLVKALSYAITCAFCVVALYLTWNEVMGEKNELKTTIVSMEWLPTWVAISVLPYTFAIMAVRFLAQCVTTATKTDEPVEERLPS